MKRLLLWGSCAWCLSTALAADRYAAPGATGSGADADDPGDLEALVAAAGEGDVVIIAGKGHETTQEIAGVKYPFDDREVVREFEIKS